MPTPFIPARNLSKGYLIALIGTMIWSTTAIIIRHITIQWQMPPIVLAFWRDLIVCAALVLLLLAFKPGLLRISRQDLTYLTGYGLVLAIFNASWTLSVYYNGASVSTVLAYSSAAYTALLAWRFLKESLDWGKILAVSLCMVGTVFVSGAHSPATWSLNPLGIITGLISGFAFAIYSLMGRQASIRQIHSLTTLTYTFGTAAIFLLAFNLVKIPGLSGISDLMWLGDSLPGWGFLILLAVGPTIGGFGLYTVSLGYLPASIANLIATLEPAFTAVQAYILLNEILTFPQIAGSILILAGVLFLRWYEDRLLARKSQPQLVT